MNWFCLIFCSIIFKQRQFKILDVQISRYDILTVHLGAVKGQLNMRIRKESNHLGAQYTYHWKKSKRMSKKSIARIYAINTKSVRQWCTQEQLKSVTLGKAKRLPEVSRHLKHNAKERQLMDWIAEQGSQCLRVSQRLIQKETNNFTSS